MNSTISFYLKSLISSSNATQKLLFFFFLMRCVLWRRNSKPMKSFFRLQRCRATALFSLSVILAITVMIIYITRGESSSQLNLPKQKWSSSKSAVEVKHLPSMGFMNGTDLMWTIPESPKAVFLIAHGCNGRASNFWDKSSGCPNCVGLPEERLIVLHALDRKFAVLAISSVGKCWTFGKEKEIVRWIIKWWIDENKLKKLPVVALGASSGGYFVSALATEMQFSSIALMIAEGVFDSINIPINYPPTLFIHMPKDKQRMELIKMNMEALRMKGVHVKEVRCMEFPLTPEFLLDRIPWLDHTFFVQLLELLHQRGFIDDQGYMRRDGRATSWKKILKENHFSSENYRWVNHIQEELNLAYGYHEMTSLQSNDIFSWFESHLSSTTNL
ncbi:uncharacterized protein LOC110019902 [Phalaenopsis equestris]|uniref:uncharacterized protein LOC110019902 n=1 Tax=Phalaenopsis equestris TaxID=78828 RepID=UPI0009E5A217|nr:uncharacterized protein LOC110019902 [Phalaenopsis equestris]